MTDDYPVKRRLARCQQCGADGVHEPNEFAYLEGGALFDYGDDLKMAHPAMAAFLNVGVHGAHAPAPTTSADALCSLADSFEGGQFEFGFCSTACLRAFLNDWVDALERAREAAAAAQSARRGKA